MVCLGFNVEYPSISFGNSYPNDCGLNICLFGDTVIYNKQTACKAIINHLDDKIHIQCNQGYSKCLVCPVDDNSIITSDKGIAKSAKSHGLNVLEIAQGHIDLPGFQYGFIGGSAFKKSKDKLVFTGTLDQHPDKPRILDFINKRGVEAVYLTDRNIFDIGSILPLTEKVR